MLRLPFSLLLTAFLAAPSTYALTAPDPPRALLARVEAALVGARPDALTAAPYASLASAVAAALNEDHKLAAPDADASDEFGVAVALDGDRALIGAQEDDGGGAGSGAAYVFAFDGTTWTLEAKLTAGGASEGDRFGHAVALDGARALVGAPQEGFANTGAAYVFAFDGTAWVQQARIVFPDPNPGAHFGGAVALDGDRAAVGASVADHSGLDAGSVYVFTFDGAGWNDGAWIRASDAATNDNFGHAVALDGDRLLVGAYGTDNGTDNGTGSAYVFEYDGVGWSEQAELTASDAAQGDQLGWAVDLDGDRALIGAPFDDYGVYDNVGAAYVFTFDGMGWSQEAKLTATERTRNDEFGRTVSLSGNRALVAAHLDDEGNATSTGAVYAFAFDGTAWPEEARLTASDAAQGDQLGWAVALDGDRVLAGAIGDDREGITNLGAAYVFDLDPVQPATASTGPVDEDGDPVPEPVDVPLEGQTEVNYAGTVGNLGPDPLTLDGWPVITFPDGSMVVRRRPTVYTLGAGDTQDYAGAFTMLASFNRGTYTFTYHTGDHPDDTWASDSFDLVKSGLVLPPIPEERAGVARGRTMATRAVARLAGLGDETWVAVGPGEDAAAVLAATSTESAPETATRPAAALGAAYPNPFNPVATVPFSLPEASAVRLTVYDVLGREVARLVDGRVEAGAHTATFDASALPSGAYLVRFEAGAHVRTQRLTLLK